MKILFVFLLFKICNLSKLPEIFKDADSIYQNPKRFFYYINTHNYENKHSFCLLLEDYNLREFSI